MRSVYYQSAGNPLQVDRLPTTRPTAEFSPGGKSLRLSVELIQIPRISAIIAAVILLTYRNLGWALLDPYDLWLTVPVIAFGVASSFAKRDPIWLHHRMVVAAIGILCLNHRVPWSMIVLLISFGSGLFVYQFGRHAVAIFTTPPVPRAISDATRASAAKMLISISAMTSIVVATTLFMSLRIVTFSAVSLCIAMLCMPIAAPSVTPRWKIWAITLLSWIRYSPLNRPGLWQSPAGSVVHRAGVIFLAAELTAISLVAWNGSPLAEIYSTGARHVAQAIEQPEVTHVGPQASLKHSAAIWLLTFTAMVALPVVVPAFVVVSMLTPLLCQISAVVNQYKRLSVTQVIVEDIPSSPDEIERNSVYLGRVVADGTPMLVPRNVFTEHAHGLGETGSGKTSLFLCPLIEQLAMSGDCSVIVIDLKADTLELLASQMAVAEKLQRERGISLPVKCFSNQKNLATFAFNPLTQPFWETFDLLMRTDILCGANGLNYGNDYGASYYSSANAAVLFQAMKQFPNVRTFQELAECVGEVITKAKKEDLHPEIRKAGVHVQEVMKRLASCAPLNVTDTSGLEPEVMERAIDLATAFTEPQLLYFHLSATLSPSGAPEIGRLVNYILLAAATQTERKHQVYLVIDEFQRMVAGNLEYMLQLARSMGVGVILANQCMEDLKKNTINLITPIESNCRLRQWFSVSASEDRERLIQSSGETVDIEYGRKADPMSDGRVRYSYSESERVVSRITMNDVLLASDHPFRSVVRISRGEGYAQYGGFPVIIQSEFHISKEEYQRRRAMPWPSLPGMFTPNNQEPALSPPVNVGPTMTQEVVGKGPARSASPNADAIDRFIGELKVQFPATDREQKEDQQ